MTPTEIAARLEELAKAGERLRGRSRRDVVEALASVLDAWRDPHSRWRRALEAELPLATGFSTPMVREALAVGLAPYSGAALRELCERELTPALRPFDTTAVLLAGSIPMPTIVSLLTPLALGSPVLAKTAARDPVTAPLFARSVAEADAELGRCLEVRSFRRGEEARARELLRAPCVVATGSDETVAAVERRMREGQRFVGYGHRLSVAALGPDAARGAALEEAVAGLARDVALWDQLGCLSPLAVYAVGMGDAELDRVAERLAEALADAERRWPRGLVEVAAAAACAHERADAELRAAAGQRVVLHACEGFTVVREADARFRAAPLHRFVRVHPVAGVAALLDAMRHLAPHLASVALSGFRDESDGIGSAIGKIGASRVCAPGEMQAPPLSWSRDGRGIFGPLALASGA